MGQKVCWKTLNSANKTDKGGCSPPFGFCGVSDMVELFFRVFWFKR